MSTCCVQCSVRWSVPGIHPQERGGDHRRLLRHKYKPLCRQIDQHILEFLISARISRQPDSSSTLHCHPCPPAASLGIQLIYTVENLRLPFIHSTSALEVCYSRTQIRATFCRVAGGHVLCSLNNAPPAAACCQTSHFHDKI